MFSGQYPTEHGRHRADQSLSCPTAERLSEQGYTTVGISANGFASQRTGFSNSFDEFYYAGGRDIFLDGINVSGTAQQLMQSADVTSTDALLEILKLIPRHDHRLKSLANLFTVACGEATIKWKPLQRLPHRIFAPDSGYCYDPEQNTTILEQVLQRDDDPYFIFLNYMDTHYPYKPGTDHQRNQLGRTLSQRKIRRLNENVAASRRFPERLATSEIPSSDIETVRGLYAGEVATVDEHLERTLDILDQTGTREDTLLIVTSDHGENLGEVDEMGRKRMGHEGSVSDAVLSVPLVISNPRLGTRTVSDPVSLKDIHGLLTDGVDKLFGSTGDVLGPLEPQEDPVMSQYPAVGGKSLFEKHPDAPRDALAYRISVDTVVGYSDGWKVVVSSNGEQWAQTNGAVVDYQEAPDALRSRCEADLSELHSDRDADDQLSDAEISQLEALGYM
jgi:arylsulfatase A-like enzyme